MKVIQPLAVTDAVLASSNIAETDAPAWAAGTTYALGARVIRATTHRVYESAIAGNIGHDPALDPINWINVAPTNRWAMFDQAVGTLTSGTGSIAVVLLFASVIDALGFVAVSAASIRVQVIKGGAVLYDMMQPAGAHSAVTFLDLPSAAGGQFFITIVGSSGSAPVAVGALIAGTALDLGETETSPQIGIVDFSKRSTDDFGVTTIVERDFAQTMTLRTRIDTALVDVVQRRFATLRAKPALWIGEVGYDSLTVYGFWKSFSVDLALGDLSYCSLAIEGLT